MKLHRPQRFWLFRRLLGSTALLVLGALVLSIPSSRARDLVKVGSPIANPVKLYGVTSVHDRNPKAYEVWAVGEELRNDGSSYTPSRGVVLYFNGTSWSKVTLPASTNGTTTTPLPVLRAVHAIRYLRTIDATGLSITSSWSTVAFAVGDDGTMLKLDPYSNTWKLQRKYRSGANAGTFCSDTDAPNVTTCENWTIQPLNAVAAVSDRFAVAVGNAETALHYSEDFNPYNLGVAGARSEAWTANAVDTDAGRTYDFRAVSFVDDVHGWVAGGCNTCGIGGKARSLGWKYTVAGYQESSGTVLTARYTSVAVMYQPVGAGQPLSSVVWFGTEEGKIYRYNESDASIVSNTLGSTPIRSLALSRHSGGQSQNVVVNGSFDADRQDYGVSQHVPDGWQVTSRYRGATDIDIEGAHLVDGNDGRGTAFVGEPWMSFSGLPTGSLAYPTFVEHKNLDDLDRITFPELVSDYSSRGFQFTNQESAVYDLTNDISVKMGYLPLAYHLGVNVRGYMKIPGNDSQAKQYQFRLLTPYDGWASLHVENDIANDNLHCVGGSNHDAPCVNDDGCSGGACYDRSGYPSSYMSGLDRRNPLVSWGRGGTCGGDINNAYGGQTACFDNTDCGFGYCDISGQRCSTFGQSCGFGEGSCVAWADQTCSNAPPERNEWVSENVDFPSAGGVMARICGSGTNAGRSCVSDAQCPAASSGQRCVVRGGGWYPYYISYFYSWKPRCSNFPNLPCASVGLNACPNGGTCETNGFTGTCRNSPTTDCLSSQDCETGDRCKVSALSPMSIKLQYRDASNPANLWEDVPNQNLRFNRQDVSGIPKVNQTSIVQSIPSSVLPGSVFKVRGRYRIEFPNPKPLLNNINDPRYPTSPRVGIVTRCRNNSGTNDACGFDYNLAQSNPAIGVTGGGTCQRSDGTTYGSCTTNAQCTTGETCLGQWKDFSVTLTRQPRTSGSTSVQLQPDDPGQSLEIVCYAKYGARIWCDDISVTPVNDAAVPNFDNIDVWAVGDGGAVFRNSFNLLNGLSTSWQLESSETSTSLRSVTAADPYHFWAVGENVPGGDRATILRLNPGNVTGWGWVGTASSPGGADPIGWVDFNCGNLGSCAGQPSSFGVDIDTGGNGKLSGSAWIGSQDSSEIIDYGPCLGAPGSGVGCLGGTCSPNSSVLCSNISQCLGTCAKNQGFRCQQDSDCKISCATNPTACKSSGWLSFDKSRTGTPPFSSNFDYNQAFTAKFDSPAGALTGWGRLQLGQCTTSKLACFQTVDCGSGGTCSYANAPGGGSDQDAGWVRLRGDAKAGGPLYNDTFIQCLACAAGSTSSNGTCKICNTDFSTGTPEGLACNQCSSCVLKRCTTARASDSSDRGDCTDSWECTANGECRTFGQCATDGSSNVCFSNSECTDQNCVFGAQCGTCNLCSSYGVSLDDVETKQFSGFAYSPDLGWMDFGRVRLGGRVFLQTRFGDIYSGGDIGSPSTARAPSFPTGPVCNATYRLVAARTITNFCSSAGTNFLQPESQLYPLPRAENRYLAEIGELDVAGLTTEADAARHRNKYGDVIDERGAAGTDTNISGIFGCGGSTCSVELSGKVYYIKGNLIVDKDTTFVAPAAVIGNGAGTFVVDGNLVVRANLSYGTAATLANRQQLPSAAFIVKGSTGITIEAAVGKVVGAYYTEQTITSASAEPDIQLTVSGVMVAKKFNFQRKFSGALTDQEPAEVITYDGRLQANTPPGLAALATGLPNLQEVVP